MPPLFSYFRCLRSFFVSYRVKIPRLGSSCTDTQPSLSGSLKQPATSSAGRVVKPSTGAVPAGYFSSISWIIRVMYSQIAAIGRFALNASPRLG